MPDFGYDVKLAITVDGTKQNSMPESPMGKNNQYYQVDVSCGSSKTTGLWDYNAWRLNLDYIESNSKCTLTFTSSMSKAQYDEYIKSGVALRRNTYRGKDITKYKDLPEDDPMNLYKQISDGTFADIYVGDYIVSDGKDARNNKIIWLIADLDNYLNQGNEPLTRHHATVIPAHKLEDNRMNAEATTAGGYAGSEMIKTLDETILPKYILPDFDTHVLEYQNLLSTTVDVARSNQFVLSDGVSSKWEWVDRKLDLMSEVNVYGTIITSSSMYDIGIDNRQYAIFQLRPELINQDLAGNRLWYWLKAVTSSTSFGLVGSRGSVHAGYHASETGGVRPRFLIG